MSTGGMMTAAELRAQAHTLLDVRWAYFRDAAEVLLKQADLLDELEKQEPVATVCKAPFCDGKTSWAIDTFNLPIGTKLYGRPQLPRDPMKLAEMVRDRCAEEDHPWLRDSIKGIDLAAIVKKWENE